jgi:hypothetical protein
VAHNVLVLLMGDVPPPHLRRLAAARSDEPLRVQVVAPTLVGGVAWLTGAEDDAYRRAQVRALEAEWTLSGEAEVEGGAGDTDPLQAVEDALRTFDADEIVVAGGNADPDLDTALARFGLPVLRLGPAKTVRRSLVYRWLRELAGGRRPGTPFLLFLTVNGAILLFSFVVSLVVVLILRLTGNL